MTKGSNEMKMRVLAVVLSDEIRKPLGGSKELE
jgi:hypothetical protein